MKNPKLRLLSLVVLMSVCRAGLSGADATRPGPQKKLTRADIDEIMASLSNSGRWGKDDELGTLNLITPEKRKQAAALVTEGVSISLARTAIKEATDSSPPFVHRMVNLPKEGEEIASAGDEYSVEYHGFTQTHLDALCHLFYRGKMYNGFSQSEVTPNGARRLSVLRVKNGIFTRCVLMHMPRLFDRPYLEGSHAIYPEDLDAWENKAGVKVGSGDAVLIRTGRWARRQVEGPWEIMKNSAGLHASCLPWIKKRDVALVGSDLATDVMPSRVDGFELPVHWVSIVAMGMPILDNCDLESASEAAAARRRWSFLLTVAPLAVDGGTGSPVNPLATF